MEKRERGTGSRRQKGRRREPEKGPSLRCYAQDEQSAEEAVRRAQEAREGPQEGQVVHAVGQRK